MTTEPTSRNTGRHRNPWFGPCNLDRPATLRLICLPYAGGAAQIYRDWGPALPPAVEVCPVQLPGRAGRFGEPPLRRMDAIADAVADAVEPLTDRSYALFGHSMGALAAFELARRLRARGARDPELLMVSGRPAPDRRQLRRRMHDLPRDEFLEALRLYNGTPDAVFRHPELLDLLLPLLRADFEAVESYVPPADAPLSCPIVAFGGTADPDVDADALQAWAAHGTGRFAVHLLPGDHFFVHSHADLLLAAIDRELKPFLATS